MMNPQRIPEKGTKTIRENRLFIRNIIFSIVAIVSIVIILVLASGTVMPRSNRIASDVIRVDRDYPGYEVSEGLNGSDPVRIYSFILDDIPLGGECLSVWLVHRDVRIYIDDVLMYDSGEIKPSRLTDSPGSYWALVPLFTDDVGKEIRVETGNAYRMLLESSPAVILSTQGSLVSYCMRVEWPGVIVGIFCMVSGVIYAILACVMRAEDDERRSFAFIGLFISFFGLYRLLDMPVITLLFNDHSMLITYINMICFTWMPAVFYLSESRRWSNNGLFRKIGMAFAAMAMILTVLQVFGIRDMWRNTSFVYICIGISFLVVLADYLIRRFVTHRDSGHSGYMITYVVIIICIMMDSLLYYRSGSTRNANIALYLVAVYGVQSGISLIRSIVSRNEEAARQKMELADRKGALMLSQIQPHFIYNTMNTIYALCDINIEDAKTAIHDFSGYLRHNFGSMEHFGPVPFEEELKHTRFYLSIEKMRFGDELNVVYDIEETDFELPPISLQPIVENAVRHGLRHKTGGGTVTITSRRNGDECVVTVQDDGAGFDTSVLGFQEPDSEHNRIALNNVSMRISQMRGGTLNIESEPGKGTIVTITVPVNKEITDEDIYS